MAIKEKTNSFFKVIRINKLWLSVFVIVLNLCAGTILGFYIKTQIGQQRKVWMKKVISVQTPLTLFLVTTCIY